MHVRPRNKAINNRKTLFCKLTLAFYVLPEADNTKNAKNN